MQKLQFGIWHTLSYMPQTICQQTKRTILERFQGHYGNTEKAITTPRTRLQANSNAHIHQLQDDTIGPHFAEITHKGTSDFKIQVLEVISLHKNSERALKLRLQKEKHWIHRLRCSAQQGLNIIE